ncbi:hypothetical protein H9I32_23230 [Bacillus sp. Xin]|uniref:hypothetical protein n=1 Tax=unclassified Bacillus (in: firmicutes) TaxID=185979 RepID=UPI001571E6B4|nr:MULTISPECIES: hypothetical protein [unclassified Bacillus (in: firmicutes)]MBC6975169.1 hypothetical protein [Bacillus sp. Xin]NSW39213.1 hypothetical protein [Bacillus sp. Xin1]
MLNHILRSPFFPMSLLVFITAFLLLSLMNTQVFLAKLCFGILIFFTFGWSLFIKLYNRRNPKNKIKSMSIVPPEFREMDEGQQWVTFKACRNVYIYYTFAIPVTVLICFIFSQNNLVPLLSIGVLGIGQYVIYWLTTIYVLKSV